MYSLLSIPYHVRRSAFFLAGDAMLLALALVTAAWLRFEWYLPAQAIAQLWIAVPLSLAAKLPLLVVQRQHGVSWSRFTLGDVLTLARCLGAGWLIFAGLVMALRLTPVLAGFSRSVLLLDLVLSLAAVGGFRLSRRIYLHIRNHGRTHGLAAIVVGAGAAGDQLVRALRDSQEPPYCPYAFIDDDPFEHGHLIHGLPVVGGRAAIGEVVRTYHAEAVLIAMPSAPPEAVRDVVARARDAGVLEIRIVPGIERVLRGGVTLADLREVQLEDLLGRQVVRTETGAIRGMLGGRTVLVTGAAGSIGSEICRQMVGFGVRRLVMVDLDETGLFNLELRLAREARNSLRLEPAVADVRDPSRMRQVFETTRPDVVFHAAAYKHVPLMESHPAEAVKTNVWGTWVPAGLAREFGVERFILISTDKAVHPVSAMGASKRLAERVVATLNRDGPTRFMSVRFGNVLGSRGSVVPTWQEQIAGGGPVTVTDPEMHRYFMLVSEAVLLVLQAAASGPGGEVYVLDMGKPIRLLDLAHEVIRLSGLEPDVDIQVVFTGIRPGEKLSEELLASDDGVAPTPHEKIFAARPEPFASVDELRLHVEAIRALAENGRPELLREALRCLVPQYTPPQA